MSESPLESKPIICEEVFDEHSVPSEEEVIEYAKKIGINPKCEPHLLPIAFQGLMQPLPKGWKPCLDASINRWYYYNKVTKVSQWEHPLDSVYRDLVKRGRSEGYSSAADDDSKGTAREGDLKSLEEVSDLVPSSKSNEPPPPPSSQNNNAALSTSASIETDMKPHQPLLLRRKQMQSGLCEQQDGHLSSLQIAKMMNNAMKEKNALVFESEESTFSIPPTRTSSSVPVTPKQLQPIRRANTLDPIPNYGLSKGPPIKGILRESSFSGLPSKIVQGGHPDRGQDEEEKKRSVRFADSERKSLDIRFSDSEDSLSESDDNLSRSESEGSDDQESEKESQSKAKVFNRLNLNAEGIKLINKKLEAINVSHIKDKLLNSPSNVKPLESSSSDESNDCNAPAVVATHPRYNRPKSPQSPPHSSPSEGKKTGRFLVSKSPVDRLPPPLFDVKSQPSFSDVTQTSDKGDSEKGEVVTVICQERPLSCNNLSREPSEEDLKTSELEDIARKKTSERLAALEERLSKEIVEKVAKMREEQAQRLDVIRAELAEKETIEKENIIKEHNEKLAQMKLSLEQELADEENDLKQKHQQELDALIERLENEREEQKLAALALHESLVASAKQEEADRFNAEKARLEAESNVELMKRQEMYASIGDASQNIYFTPMSTSVATA